MSVATSSDEKVVAVVENTTATPALLPPLEAAARRLERLLSAEQVLDFYTNPVKVVRRWLGTSSGAAGRATADDIARAAVQLLDPDVSASGRALLLAYASKISSSSSSSSTSTAMDTTEPAEEDKPLPSSASYLTPASSREVESWLTSLAVRLLWKQGQSTEALELAQKGIEILQQHVEGSPSSSSLFPLLARLWRWRCLVAESMPTPLAAGSLARAHNGATLRRDVDTQATLLNQMLRDLLRHAQSTSMCSIVWYYFYYYIEYFFILCVVLTILLSLSYYYYYSDSQSKHTVEQAQKLLANSTFPESASNNQLCRYLYYSGRIQALRLEYTLAFSNLSQCLRKAPTHTATGFRIAAQRLLVVVQLLMGEIPERHVFFQKGIQAELHPYLSIAQAVRRGDLVVFEQVVSQHTLRLQQDETQTLIARLAHQVVKAGLRKLHVSYSRLSLVDVAQRLGLPSAQSAEYVVAKAVRDGVLDATIHHDQGYVQSHDLVDVYATKEPAEAFHRRIAYCLTTHNDAVRGMRYPPDAYKKQLEASRGMRRKRPDDKTDEEKAKELEDEFDEDY